MKNFFVPKTQFIVGISTGLESCELRIGEIDGLVFDEGEFAKLLQKGFVIREQRETEVEGIFEVVLKPRVPSRPGPAPTPVVPVPSQEFKVLVEQWNGDGKEKFLAIIKEVLLPLIKRDIVLDVPHNNPKFYTTGRKEFTVSVWSQTSNQTDTVHCPGTLWGTKVPCTDSGYSPSGEGIPICDGGYCVAELLPHVVYIHHDAVHTGNEAELKIFRRILEECVAELTLSPQEKELRMRRLQEERRIRSREQYLKECSRRFERSTAETVEKIKKGKEEIEKHQQLLVKKIREVAGCEKKLEQMSNTKPTELNRYGAEFDALSAVPGVEDVQVADGVVKVFTEHIFITPDGCPDTYDIGKFRMEIYTSGSNAGIRFFNLTRQGTGKGYNSHHPHVQKDGAPCLGNIQSIVAELVGNYEYSAVAQIGLQYLKSVNTGDSAGKGIFTHWPKVEKKEGAAHV